MNIKEAYNNWAQQYDGNNNVEVAIRVYDPCLSCAAQAMRKMPLKAELFNHKSELINEPCKEG